jgi:hypothetical protein
MNEIEKVTSIPNASQKDLEALVVDNPDLERLEALLDQFNIFEVIGAVRQELRHSDFLAFLLDPQQNHGLGDAFLKKLLQKVLMAGLDTKVPITLIDLDVWSLAHMRVMREWHNIDILLVDDSHQLIILIENKIDSHEHSGQLQRYLMLTQAHYPSWKIIGLYLTPEGESPSHEAFLAVEYGLLCKVLEDLTESRSSTLGADVLTAIRHYTQMLRRHIVSDSEIAELCRRIYLKHRRALDLIYEHRPDQQSAVRAILEELVERTPGLVLDHSTKSYIRFTPKEWDMPILLEGKGWTPSGRLLLFEFANAIDALTLKLLVGPGPQVTRLRLFEMAQSAPFKSKYKSLPTKWASIYQRHFLAKESFEETSDDELAEEIGKHWKTFVQNDLPVLTAAIKAQQWIMSPTNTVS